MSEIRRVGRHTLIYGIGVVLSRLVSFIMLPVYTRFLTPADYGILELLGTTIDVIGMIAGIGLASGVFKHYAELATERERRELLSTVALGSGAISLAVMLAGIGASPQLTHLVLGDEHTPLYFRLFFLSYFLQGLSNLPLMLIQAEERSQLFVSINVAKLAGTLALTILFVVHLRMGVLGVLYGNVISAAVMALGLGTYLFRRVGVHFSAEKFRRLSRFGAPVAVWTVGSFILTFSDRYFLNHFTGADAVGVYSLAYKFSFLLSAFAVAPFSQIWEPRRFAIASQPDAGQVYRRMFLYVNLALFVGSIGILLFIKDGLRILVGAAFVPAYHVVPLLLVTTIIQQWTGYCNLGLYLKNATGLYGWSAVVGVVAALALNFLLIPRWGMYGAAWATVLAYAIRFVPVYVLAQARYHVDYPWARVGEMTLLLGAAWFTRYAADGLALIPSLTVSIVTAMAIGAVIYVRLLEPAERAFVRALLRRPLTALSTRAA